MPIYEYRCEACGHEMDALQKISDPPLTDCPSCGASALKKQLSAAAFRLKGSGWYETDFKQNGRKNLHEAGNKPAGGSEASGDKSKSDGKAATQTETSTKSDSAKAAPASSKPAESSKPAATNRKAA